MSFILVCWVMHRTLEARTQCLSSPFISFVQIGSVRVENCRFVSRLSLAPMLHPLDSEREQMIRALEVLEPLNQVFPQTQPKLAVEINLEAPHIFELGQGYIRLGREWLTDPVQTKRALILGELKREQPGTQVSEFERELEADFLLTTVFGESDWQGHSLRAEVKFPTSSPAFSEYCKSPFRSLAHYDACAMEKPDDDDPQSSIWGYRSLLTAALARIYEKVSLRTKLSMMDMIRHGVKFESMADLSDYSIESRAHWFEQTLNRETRAFGLHDSDETRSSIKRTLRELDVDTQTHWELTVDLMNTPAWKDVLEQFRTWTKYHPKDRVLVFTPEGALALPSGLPVAWATDEIQSQKHVLIACQWPKPDEAMPVRARHFFARQMCGKVDQIFWN